MVVKRGFQTDPGPWAAEDFPGRREERELKFILKIKVGLMDFDSIKNILN